MNSLDNEILKTKMHSEDRILVLEPKDGKTAEDVNAKGMIDTDLFKGKNYLHAYLAPNNLWSLKYERGVLPKPLQQQFTNINQLLVFVKEYFLKRDIVVKDVIDVWH